MEQLNYIYIDHLISDNLGIVDDLIDDLQLDNIMENGAGSDTKSFEGMVYIFCGPIVRMLHISSEYV